MGCLVKITRFCILSHILKNNDDNNLRYPKWFLSSVIFTLTFLKRFYLQSFPAFFASACLPSSFLFFFSCSPKPANVHEFPSESGQYPFEIKSHYACFHIPTGRQPKIPFAGTTYLFALVHGDRHLKYGE